MGGMDLSGGGGMNVARICGGMSITAGPESPERAGCPRPPCLPPRIMILNGESDVASAAARNSEQAALGGLMPFGCHASQLIWMNTVKSVDLGTYAYIPGTNRACVDGKTVCGEFRHKRHLLSTMV